MSPGDRLRAPDGVLGHRALMGSREPRGSLVIQLVYHARTQKRVKRVVFRGWASSYSSISFRVSKTAKMGEKGTSISKLHTSYSKRVAKSDRWEKKTDTNVTCLYILYLFFCKLKKYEDHHSL